MHECRAKEKGGVVNETAPSQAIADLRRRLQHPVVIQDAGERPLVLHSCADRPIAELGFLPRCLLFAELAMVAYNDESEARLAASAMGFPDVLLLDNDGSQAYRFRNRYDCVIACRGTEPDDWNDIQADVNATTVVAETVGRVHRGFKREVDDLWPMVEEVLNRNRLPLWICGHSLGGAMAVICGARACGGGLRREPEAVFTFGAPRVGDRLYVTHADVPCYRFVNNNDVVTRLPPMWMGYHHEGDEYYFNSHDRLVRLGPLRRRFDHWRGVLRGLWRGDLDLLSDHKIHRYVACVLNELRAHLDGEARTSGMLFEESKLIRKAG